MQSGGHDGGQPDRARADHGDRVAGDDPTVADAYLVAGGQDVGEEEQLLVREYLGHRVHAGLGVGHAHVLGLGAVDEVPEDPPYAADGWQWLGMLRLQ